MTDLEQVTAAISAKAQADLKNEVEAAIGPLCFFIANEGCAHQTTNLKLGGGAVAHIEDCVAAIRKALMTSLLDSRVAELTDKFILAAGKVLVAPDAGGHPFEEGPQFDSPDDADDEA